MGRMLKELEEAKESVIKQHEITLRKIQKADEIAKRVKEFLPKGWRIEFSLLFGDLDFSRTISDMFEFRNVCNAVEKITGTKMVRKYVKSIGENNEEYVSFFYGKSYVPLEKDCFETVEVNVTMHIPEENQKDCILEYEEKVIKIAKIDPGCLGNHQAKEA